MVSQVPQCRVLPLLRLVMACFTCLGKSQLHALSGFLGCLLTNAKELALPQPPMCFERSSYGGGGRTHVFNQLARLPSCFTATTPHVLTNFEAYVIDLLRSLVILVMAASLFNGAFLDGGGSLVTAKSTGQPSSETWQLLIARAATFLMSRMSSGTSVL